MAITYESNILKTLLTWPYHSLVGSLLPYLHFTESESWQSNLQMQSNENYFSRNEFLQFMLRNIFLLS